MKVTLRQLHYFRALAESHSFGRAAALVNVSQPALSMQIKELETILGTALVERGPREVRLTRAGRGVLDRAERILQETMELETDARHARGLGALNIGMIPTVAPYLLPGTLAALRATDITRDLRLREAQTAPLLDALRDGRLDAIVLADPPPAPDLIAQPLFRDRFVLAGSPTRLGALGGTARKRCGPSDCLQTSCFCWTKATAWLTRRWKFARLIGARRGWTWVHPRCPRCADWSHKASG